MILRALRESDREAIKRSFSGCQTCNKFDWDYSKPEEIFEKLLKPVVNAPTNGDLVFGIFDDNIGERFYGVCSLMDIKRGIFQNAYIGIRLVNSAWGQGLAKQAVSWVINYAFEELSLHRLEAAIEPDNISSVKLFEKAGFRFEGLSKRRLWVRSQWSDFMIFAITKEDLMSKNSCE